MEGVLLLSLFTEECAVRSMGVTGLNSFIAATYPGAMLPVQGQTSMPYDHVLFDLNGIIHQACRRRGSEKEVVKAVIAEVTAFLKSL